MFTFVFHSFRTKSGFFKVRLNCNLYLAQRLALEQKSFIIESYFRNRWRVGGLGEQNYLEEFGTEIFRVIAGHKIIIKQSECDCFVKLVTFRIKCHNFQKQLFGEYFLSNQFKQKHTIEQRNYSNTSYF